MFSKHKEQILSSKQKTNVQTSYHESYVTSQQTKGFGPNFQNQRFSQKNFQRRDFKSTEQKSYHRVPHKNKFLNEQKVFQRNNVGYHNKFQNRYTPFGSKKDPTRNFETLKVQGKSNEPFKPNPTSFPNPP